MKTLLLTIFTFLTAATLWAQAPQRISYQSVIRDGSNVVVASTTVGVKISLVQGTATGTVVYAETHRKATNANGLLSLEIGEGTVLSGTFAGIDWANGPYLIKTETDPTGGTNYSISGIAALNSVPYALFSANGTPGPQGERGATGPAGPTGAPGAAGPAGANGTNGIDGVAGPVGPQGPIGLTGSAGPTGATGPAGAAGPAGANGTNGIDGVAGPVGPQGPIGLTGSAGPTGATGPAGANGTNGIDGVAGPAGPQGPIGLTGPAGAPGTNGAAGAAGNNGTNGLDGKTVLNGTVNPTTEGVDGDFYINTTTSTLFGPKASNAWPTGISLIGIASVGTVSGTSTANGASISAGVLSLAPANASNGGIVTTGAQSFAGAKTFLADLVVNGKTVGEGKTNGGENTAVGNEVLKNNDVSSSSDRGLRNTGVGFKALLSNTRGSGNTAIGHSSLFSNTSGGGNVAIGFEALKNNTFRDDNIAIGRQSLLNNLGRYNIAIGLEALKANIEESANIAIGVYALKNNVGDNNVALGYGALEKNEEGINNVAIGTFAGVNGLTTIKNSTFSVFIGHQARPAATDNQYNQIVIGYGATGNGENTIQLGNADITNVKTSGTLTAGTVTYPNAHNSIAGQVLTTNASGVANWATPASSSSATYSIGLNAELGGYVVYVGEGSQHGLVVATQDQGSATNDWYSVQNTVSDPINHNISGKKFTDWRLPTLYELTTYLFPRRAAIGGFDVTSGYWSSTEFNATEARYVFFGNNFIDKQSKDGSQALKIRAVRSF